MTGIPQEDKHLCIVLAHNLLVFSFLSSDHSKTSIPVIEAELNLKAGLLDLVQLQLQTQPNHQDPFITQQLQHHVDIQNAFADAQEQLYKPRQQDELC
jgi:hypothetical protein